MEKRDSFARAWSFLNFKPGAKYLALSAAVLSSILYIVLLLLLGLFADLMVYRGQVPRFADLSPEEREAFQKSWAALPQEDRQKRLQDLGIDEPAARLLAAAAPDVILQDTLAVPWQAEVNHVLTERVGPVAGEHYRVRCTGSALEQPNMGVLALIVRTRDRYISRVLGALADRNAWMWEFGETDESNLAYLGGLAGLAIGVVLLRRLSLFAMKVLAAATVIEAGSRLRLAVYHHAYRLGALAVRALGPSEAVTMFTRHIDSMQDALYAGLTVLVREPVKIVLLLLFALLVNFWLAVVFVIFALLVWLVAGNIGASCREQAEKAANRAANQFTTLQESLMLMRLVKAYVMELFNKSRVEKQLAAYGRSLLARYRANALTQFVLGFLGMIAVVALLFVAGWVVLQGQLSVASAIVLVTALVSLYWPVENSLDQWRSLRRGRESAGLLFKFLDRPVDVRQEPGAENLPPLAQRLEFDGVSLREPGGTRMLLQGISLSIPVGQRVALVGPDDMEKHALVYLIPRFLDPTSGEIRIDDHNLRWVTLESLRSQLGVVLQQSLVFNDTVAHNISGGDSSYPLPRIIEAAKVAHAHNFIQKLPKGYDTPLGELGQGLNVGEQFRIALARAILRDPALVIIEEPPAVLLDEDTRSLLDDTFTRFLTGRTAIFLPHRLATIRSCEQVYLLHKGKIVAKGEHRQLLAQSELYQHLHYLEFNVFAGQL